MTDQVRPKAFISCSLREEDADFVDYVARIVYAHGFEPCGTVGKYSASPEPLWKQMNDGIKGCDCIVLIATPRYITQDIFDRKKTGQGISENLHVEIGMAIASGRPIMAFVKEGTDVGSFLPQTTQFIVLNPYDRMDYEIKRALIANYFRSAFAIIQDRWRRENNMGLLKLAGGILTAIGAVSVLDSIFSRNEDEY